MLLTKVPIRGTPRLMPLGLWQRMKGLWGTEPLLGFRGLIQ